jgi:hypothetical protein
MTIADPDSSRIRLTLAVVLDVTEEACTTWSHAGRTVTQFAAQFPQPRVERISAGHLVAIATAADGRSAVVWRWYDAVVLGDDRPVRVQLWEPGHGVVDATQTVHYRSRPPGARAYASAGLHGSEWRVSGPVVENPADAEVELDEVRALFDDNGLQSSAFGAVQG